MALTAIRKAELAAMTLPTDEETRARMRAFMLRSGLSHREFAEAVGYSPSSIDLFMAGRYDANHPKAENTLAVRAAAKRYMDLHELADTLVFNRRHHETKSFREVRTAAWNALHRSTAYIVDGPPGTEKTESLRRVERAINESGRGRAVYVYARVAHKPQSFLIECCVAAGVPSRGTIDALLRKLRFFLAGRKTLFIVDEAQHLDHAGLEVLRQLLDLPPHFGVVLAGSHDLTQRLSHWTMEQWRSRVRRTIELNGPSREDCHRILRAELGADLSDEDCDLTIAECQSTAQRVALVKGKPTARTFTYTSARSLFGAIEQANEALTGAALPREKEQGAA